MFHSNYVFNKHTQSDAEGSGFAAERRPLLVGSVTTLLWDQMVCFSVDAISPNKQIASKINSTNVLPVSTFMCLWNI